MSEGDASPGNGRRLGRPRPPRVVEQILRSLLPRGDFAFALLGDLEEEYHAFARARSRIAATLWYWLEGLRIASRFGWRRIQRSPTDSAVRKRREIEAGGAGGGGSGRSTGQPFARPPLPRGNRTMRTRLEDLFRDALYATRTLKKWPGFAAISVLVLAIGIGAVSVMYSTLYGVVLSPLHYDEPDRLMWISSTTESGALNSTSALDYVDYHARNDVFAELGAHLVFQLGVVITGEGEPDLVPMSMVSANLFAVFGVAPLMGRTFTAEEQVDGGPAVVILSHRYWQRRLGSDPDVVGKTFLVGGQPTEIVGVLPAEFRYLEGVDLWFPMRMGDGWTSGRGNNNFRMLGRLADGVTLDEAQSQMDVLAAQIAEAYPDTKKDWGIRMRPLHEIMFGDLRSAMFVLMGAVGLFLLIACANLSSMLLARVASRHGEIAVRLSLGAPRAAIVRQLLVESFLITVMGAAVGLLLAHYGIRAVQTFAPGNLPRLDTVAMDGGVLLFAGVVTVASGLLFGILPALRATRVGLVQSLKEGAQGTETGRSLRWRGGLVVAQVALSLMLLIGSGLLIRSFLTLSRVDPGFEVEGLVTFDLTPPTYKYTDETGVRRDRIGQLFSQVREEVLALPGVIGFAGVEQLPLYGGASNYVWPADTPPSQPQDRILAARRRATVGYFRTMGIPLVAGRTFEPTDTPESTRVTIISEELARRAFPNGDALGKEVMLTFNDIGPFQVVGIVADVSDNGLGAKPVPVFYVSNRQFAALALRMVLRSDGDAMTLMPSVRERIWGIDRDMPISELRSMESIVSNATARARFSTALLTLFAAMALLLAAMGLYGVLAYFVSQRSREVGIRVALGASPGDVISAVVRRGIVLVSIGALLGIGGSIALSSLVTSMLYDIAPTDLATYVLVTALLLSVALAACVLPARRAVRVDPVIALRSG
jgi:putative ABC transport system permease protein